MKLSPKQVERELQNYRNYLEAGLPRLGSFEDIMSRIKRLEDKDLLFKLYQAAEERLDSLSEPNNETPVTVKPKEKIKDKEIDYQQLLQLPHPLSKYQSDVLDWVLYGSGNAACNAVAGSGKSTTLVYATMALAILKGFKPDEIRLVVFGNENSKDLRAKLTSKLGTAWDGAAKTMHSLGFSMLKNELGEFARAGDKNPRHGLGRIDSYKYHKIAKELGYANATRSGREKGSLVDNQIIDKPTTFIKLVDFCRFQLIDFAKPDQLRQMISHFGDQLDGVLELEGEGFQALTEALRLTLKQGQDQARSEKVIDFADQIWLPVTWRLDLCGWFDKFNFKFLFVDECQDFNPCQRELSLMMAGETGRLLYVGDPSQSIMGFAGADCNSFEQIVENGNCIELPLSVCYRCPQTHIEFVRSEFPGIPIEPFDHAPEGKMGILNEDHLWNKDVPEHLQNGDLILCRKTAPLVSLCIKLISKGVAARVKGREIGKGLINELESVEKLMNANKAPFRAFPEWLDKYHQYKLDGLRSMDNYEQLAESLQDKIDALQVIYERYMHVQGCKELAVAIEDLFSDKASPITLSTAHRAKGLEADRVFIVQPDCLPMVWKNQTDWQSEQEENLRYVALTRAKKALYVVQSDKACEWLNRFGRYTESIVSG